MPLLFLTKSLSGGLPSFALTLLVTSPAL
jgi:hypothetical protein